MARGKEGARSRSGRMRTREAKKIDWFFGSRFGPGLLSGIDCLMRQRKHDAALYLMLVAVEVLSSFREGRPADGDSFDAFMRDYFNEILSTRVRNPFYRNPLAGDSIAEKREIAYADVLRAFFRERFEKSCVPLPGISLASRSRYYCRFYRRIGLRLDVTRFHRDFRRACRRYQNDVVGDYLVRRRFVRRFDQVYAGKRLPRKRTG